MGEQVLLGYAHPNSSPRSEYLRCCRHQRSQILRSLRYVGFLSLRHRLGIRLGY